MRRGDDLCNLRAMCLNKNFVIKPEEKACLRGGVKFRATYSVLAKEYSIHALSITMMGIYASNQQVQAQLQV